MVFLGGHSESCCRKPCSSPGATIAYNFTPFTTSVEVVPIESRCYFDMALSIASIRQKKHSGISTTSLVVCLLILCRR